MDQNGSSSSAAAAAPPKEIENSNTNRSNKYNHLFTKKTLQFLVPISVISFLLAYASCFSFIFTYNFHFSTLLFAVFSRALERKYMFLICNGILAFLVKTLSFNSCPSPPPPPHVSDFIHDESMKATEDQKPKSSVPYEEPTVLPVQYYSSISKNLAVEEEEEEEEKEEEKQEKEEEKAPDEGGKQSKSQMGCSWIIASDDIYSSEDDDYETDIKESAAAASLLGASLVAEEGNEINLNTEELNQKFEEFIRKMKEEIRIEAQQQLVVA